MNVIAVVTSDNNLDHQRDYRTERSSPYGPTFLIQCEDNVISISSTHSVMMEIREKLKENLQS